MVRSGVRGTLVALAGAAFAVIFVQAPAGAQSAGQTLGSVNVNRSVIANGQPLAAGTYTLRLLPDELSKVVGQTPSESKWVEFVRGGKVVGKEVATVLTAAEARAVNKGMGPASGGSKTQLLKGNEYLRIWVNRGGTHYLVHLAVAKSRP
jgi:hypothetical protein